MSSSLPNGAPTSVPPALSRPFLHPTISRLRSYIPHASPAPSATSALSAFPGLSPVPSSFSTLSPMSSSAHLPLPGTEKRDLPQTNGHDPDAREVFRWTQLRALGPHVFSRPSNKAQAVLGTSTLGAPMVMAANGLICVGTESGRILVFDFKQTLRCVCGDPATAIAGRRKDLGAVTALALSHDHTFVAAGHATGHIQLFDLSKPQVPARSVPPTTLAAVASGRKEGHLQGSRIVNIGFIAGRHTAIVTADQTGLAFYHSLGKALFFEASDVLRILGKYPNEEPSHGRHHLSTDDAHDVQRHPRHGAAALGTVPHPTDMYNMTALLTGAKLVIVGLKPSPKTWYRKHREEEDEQMGKAKFRAALAWFPSVVPGALASHTKLAPAKKENTKGVPQPPPTTPMLVYSWGSTLHLLLVSELKALESFTSQRTGKVTTVEVGRLVFEEKAQWSARDNVHAIQWLNVNQILVVTASALEVYDVHTRTLLEHVHFDPSSLVSPTIAHTVNGAYSYLDATGDIAHSVRTYKGKIFLLGRHEMQVGTLLTWADRILSFVENGDFLSAIDLTRSYYLGTAPGNKNGLPEDPLELKKVVGEKMRELMTASMRYAFSEDRMTDATHHSPDGRGVDRTLLFENLVVTCARACIALGDLEFLFEDLFQAYDDAGIAPIYLEQLETFVLEHDVRAVDPRIAQRLIALHAANGRPDRAERVIWHIDPAFLDIDQVVQLCQTHRLYDALIYVYTRAMWDYVAPVVEMLGLIRKVMQLRRSPVPDEAALEPLIVNAYKVYPYLADVLSGLTYPSEEPLDEDEATQAKRDLYNFLFHGRSSSWPRGDGGKLVLTAEEDGGVEPTYPYCRLLLRFDAEAFLHTLDLVFEDAYLNDEAKADPARNPASSPSSSLATPSSDLPPAARMFFIQMSPSVLHSILVGLTTDYLLSAYTPQEGEELLQLFEDAGFYRILRTWHRQEGRWAPLLLAHLQDPDIFTTAARSHSGTVPGDLIATVAVVDTARFLNRHAPQHHERAVDSMGSDADHERFTYLHCLLGPSSRDEEHPLSGPSLGVPPQLRKMYVGLLCKIDPAGVIPSLEYLGAEFLDWEDALRTCEEHEVFDAVVWALNWRGNPGAALKKFETFGSRLSATIGWLVAQGASLSEQQLQQHVENLEVIGRIGVIICVERSSKQVQGAAMEDVSVEDLWFRLLRTQIGTVQAVSACCPSETFTLKTESSGEQEESPTLRALTTLRSLVQTTFSALVSASALGVAVVVYPSLDYDNGGYSGGGDVWCGRGTPYTEFRTILTGMMEAYRAEGDMLMITKHLLDRDVFQTIEMATRARTRGWTPRVNSCATSTWWHGGSWRGEGE
ncbi:Golgi CORVET complex core vacuolar protein 8-domain-containing protein [Multifurca ochricompacta]|uniref:Golgi CORVET complex core vacuolar protein 8-domain-containing protein n=1 Tax=Multifurca ochricompacta TaxID=376703 RepID=A0AAD4M3X4_9AGAM|nr:Golgi CORVET complex core vacuolar protein 8-domain-containing protein [Multifurca ochricompacta]